jgi:hypothetical protein
MPRPKRTTLRIWAHQYRVMADRLAFHALTSKLDPKAEAAVREAQEALLEAAAAVEANEQRLTAA